MQAASDKAETERRLCYDWLLGIMKASPKKARTKADLRAEAVARFNVSKNSFDRAWISAIEETAHHEWYVPLRKSRQTAKSKIGGTRK